MSYSMYRGWDRLVGEAGARRTQSRRRALSGLTVAAIALALASPGFAAVIVIDDFTSDTLSPAYTQSNALVNGTAATVTFDTTTNDDLLTYRVLTAQGSPNATQTTLFRNDYSLGNVSDGDYVQLTTSIHSTTSQSVLGGLALDSASISPTTRANLYCLLLLGDGKVRVHQGGSDVFTSSSAVVTTGNPVTLRIVRESANSVSSWYSTDGGANFTQIDVVRTVAAFNAMGMYAGNARSATPTIRYDDFVITPDPATLGLLALGGLGVLRRRPRRG